jgi:hypothetical protein
MPVVIFKRFMTETHKTKAISEGVSRAFGFWFQDHEISFPDLLECAIRDSFDRWLKEHSDDVIAAIAERTKPNQSES